MPSCKQKEIFKFIQHYILQHGYSPSEVEIASYIGQTRKTIRKALAYLEECKLIKLTHGRKRNICLEAKLLADLNLPITGKIAAGKPIEPLESQQVLALSDILLGPNRFVLQIVGNSMSGDNICDGDFIICERRDTAEDGDIIVALINETESTLKRLQKNLDGTVALVPSNPDIAPMIYPDEVVKIQGVYLGLIRLT